MKQNYPSRFALCVLGLSFYGLGGALGVLAGSAGTNAWSTLALGISDLTAISYGTGTFLVSLAVLLIDFLGKGKLGFGTLLNAVLIPVFSELFLALFAFLPPVTHPVLGTALSLLGQTVIAFATILYMMPALGCGPRDTLMVIIGRRFPRLPIGTVKFFIELAVLLIGVLLGAPFGIGTVLVMALQASIFQMVCRICRYEPRDVVHEDFADTVKGIFKK